MMRGAIWLGLGLGLVACEGDTDDMVMPTGDTGVDEPECTNRVDTTVPAADAMGVYYRGAVRITLGASDPAATISLADADGNDVPGMSRVEERIVIFEPTDPLATSTTYTATLSYECGDETLTFTTSDTGEPTTVDPIGRVYSLDLTAGEWTRPPGIGAVISNLITEDVTLLFMANLIVDDGDNDTINYIGAPASATDGNAQDVCETPFLVEDAIWNDPYFEGSTPELAITVAGISVTIQDLLIAGDYSVDGSVIEIDRFAGEIDTRELAALPIGDLCKTIGALGVPCAPCSFEPASETCLDLQVENLVLPYLPDAVALDPMPVCPE